MAHRLRQPVAVQDIIVKILLELPGDIHGKRRSGAGTDSKRTEVVGYSGLFHHIDRQCVDIGDSKEHRPFFTLDCRHKTAD